MVLHKFMHLPGKNIILASASSSRRRMLAHAGIDFETVPARTDEQSLKVTLLAGGTSPRDISDALAEMKAQKVSSKNPGAFVIGSDQVLECDGQLCSKMTTLEAAKIQLQNLRGKTHRLYSAVVISQDGAPLWRYIGRADMVMHDFSDAFIDDYLTAAGTDILASVGCYFYEEHGSRLFLKTTGDYFVILGMPLLEVLAYLRQQGAIQK